MSLGLAIFASVVLVLAVYHKPFRKVLLYAVAVGVVLGAIGFGGVVLYDRHQAAKYETHRASVRSCIERNKNVGDIFDQLSASGKSLEEQCESDPTIDIAPTTKKPAPGVLPIYGGETLKVARAGEETGGHKVNPPAGAVPVLYLGHNQKFAVTCGQYGEHGAGAKPVIEGITITCN